MRLLVIVWFWVAAISAMYTTEKLEKELEKFNANNQNWLKSHEGRYRDYDEPVFWGLAKHHFFYQKTTRGWSGGLAVSPKSRMPFRRDSAARMCRRSKRILKKDPQIKAYQLMTDSMRRSAGLRALYVSKDGHFLQIATFGSWRAAVFRDGKLVKSTKCCEFEQGPKWKPRTLALAENWEIEDNDLLVVTKGDAKWDEDVIRAAVESGENAKVSLSQIASNIWPNYKGATRKKPQEPLVMLRMVKSSDQVSEL